MKKTIFLVLLAISIVSIQSCTKTIGRNEVNSIYKEQGLQYFNQIKLTYKNPNSILMVDSLINNLEWESQATINLQNDVNLVLINIDTAYKTLNKTVQKKQQKLVLQYQKGKITYAYVIDVIGNLGNKNLSEILFDNVTNYKKIREQNSFLLSTVSITGKLILEYKYKDGNLNAVSYFNSKPPNKEGQIKGKSNNAAYDRIDAKGIQCTNWYLVTTYFYTDGTTSETWEYLYTTCIGEDCQITRDIDHTIKFIKSNCSSGGGEQTYQQSEELLFLYSEDFPLVDIVKIFKCFQNISNNGAQYSLKLSVDIPVNSDPDKLTSGSTAGHVYLTFEKANGSQSISQTIGFYPKNSFLSLSMMYVQSAIRNDGFNNFERDEDASITMSNMSELDFNSAMNIATLYANSAQYKLDDYNCSNYAIDVFNFVRNWSDRISIPNTSYFGITNGLAPKGVYQYLNSRKGIDPNIKIGNYKAKTSHGECN